MKYFFLLLLICFSLNAYSASDRDKINELTKNEYERPLSSTYLTFPEWFIVYMSQDYAEFIKHNKPSRFPYFAEIASFWKCYQTVYRETKKLNNFNWGDHFMLWVIGFSQSAEFAIKSIYEHSIGIFTEYIGGHDTDEDNFVKALHADYVRFIYDYPWYEYPFASRFNLLWEKVPTEGPNKIRKWERRLVLSAELFVKSLYGQMTKEGTKGLYGQTAYKIYALTRAFNWPSLNDKRIERVAPLNDLELIRIPRFNEFTSLVPELVKRGVVFKEIAGNKKIFATILIKDDANPQFTEQNILFKMDSPLQNSITRWGILIPLHTFDSFFSQINGTTVLLEHLYDY
ncbi:hypothetical protein K1X76_00580 [bacterium]|nr:hypothetical protein [bacterium]